ncbi:MAG: ATP-dependent sacrificial sulfur transferase LarE [Clostridiales bacterium]|nr:ATP-dependent sacrificial sulfur transferase LarE [Clostridiales bacterium]
MTLENFFEEHKKIAVAFSGGTDSAYLLYMAKVCGAGVTAIYVKTPFQPRFELDDARRFCGEYDIPLTVVEYDILTDPVIAANPADRCYHCKRALFTQIIETAGTLGYDEVADGTNASDDAATRPGMRALSEMGILSPLRLCGLTKNKIRIDSARLGLFTADKPSYSCLATRIPTDTMITSKMLNKIEQSETALSKLDFIDFRVRCLSSDSARIQTRESQLPLVLDRREEILAALTPYFAEVYLDLSPR